MNPLERIRTKRPMRHKGTLRREVKMINRPSDLEPMESASFEWAKLNDNEYLVITPKIFRKQLGNSFAIVSKDTFLRLLNT